MGSGLYAHDVYPSMGVAPEPTSSPIPDHMPGPAPFAKKDPARQTAGGYLANPTLVLVVLLGLAVLLIQFSVRFDFEVSG